MSDDEPVSADSTGLVVTVGNADPWELSTDQELGFGRAAELVLDDNPYLHRQVGRFVYTGSWTLRNDGASIVLRVLDPAGHLAESVLPGSKAVLDPRGGAVELTAGSTTYLLNFTVDGAEPAAVGGTIDLDRSVIGAMSRRETRVLLAMCEPRLHNPGSSRVLIPSVSQLASRLGLTLPQVLETQNSISTRFNPKAALHAGGATADDPGTAAALVVQWAIDTELVTLDELSTLNSPVTQLFHRG